MHECARPDCPYWTCHPSRLCALCWERREAQFAAEDALGDAMARRRGPGASSTACDDQLAPAFDDPDAPVAGLKRDTDRLFDIAIELLQSATEAYQQALVLGKQGQRSESQLLQLWADTLRSAGEQVGDEAIRLGGE
ncbi:hypothetical protein [Halomonas sp.]|uniref:hypothetical protein n=1 Tax=Halomonas sp. TaxID=1486246 RepID=UPI003D108C97